ncbi:MAG: phosphate regulon sensor histidine kinase PhoR [Burkholderiales bacterium]|jgi:two-component system phosphate regulon sensor histidine kinase PhoR
MFYVVFELLFWLALVALPVWIWLDAVAALLAASAYLVLHVLIQDWKFTRFQNWLNSTYLQANPAWSGAWLDVATRIQRQQLLAENSSKLHERRLQDFLLAIQASPNGVILLDDEARIDWCNDTAASHLGLDVKKDRLQHIVHLVRDPLFTRYFAQENHPSEVLIDGRSTSVSNLRKLSVQLHKYGDGRLLLLSRDVTEVVKAEAMRRDFVANVSHEIRTPLTVLGGFVETLQSVPLDANDIQKYLHLMAIQSDRMQSLVADLLTLSQLEVSQSPSGQDYVSIPDLINQVISEANALTSLIADQFSGQKHELIFDQAPCLYVMGSKSELFSALSNLVSNAIRYTPLGGLVHLTFSQTDDRLTISVKDTGPGIASEHLPRLTERFYRIDQSRSRETGGTGLGLAITKHVMQRHGGELQIQSELGKGSTFNLIFPASRISNQIATPDLHTTT